MPKIPRDVISAPKVRSSRRGQAGSNGTPAEPGRGAAPGDLWSPAARPAHSGLPLRPAAGGAGPPMLQPKSAGGLRRGGSERSAAHGGPAPATAGDDARQIKLEHLRRAGLLDGPLLDARRLEHVIPLLPTHLLKVLPSADAALPPAERQLRALIQFHEFLGTTHHALQHAIEAEAGLPTQLHAVQARVAAGDSLLQRKQDATAINYLLDQREMLLATHAKLQARLVRYTRMLSWRGVLQSAHQALRTAWPYPVSLAGPFAAPSNAPAAAPPDDLEQVAAAMVQLASAPPADPQWRDLEQATAALVELAGSPPAASRHPKRQREDAAAQTAAHTLSGLDRARGGVPAPGRKPVTELSAAKRGRLRNALIRRYPDLWVLVCASQPGSDRDRQLLDSRTAELLSHLSDAQVLGVATPGWGDFVIQGRPFRR